MLKTSHQVHWSF